MTRICIAPSPRVDTRPFGPTPAWLAFADRVRFMRDGGWSRMALIFKIVTEALWREAQAVGRLDGASVDRADGFIHFSTDAQVAETAARHFAEQANLLLVAVETTALGDALRWEPSRGGALFPHLYAPLFLDAVRWTAPLPLGPDGMHVFPDRPA